MLITRTTVRGSERVPRSGAAVIVSNHLAAVDPALLVGVISLVIDWPWQLQFVAFAIFAVASGSHQKVVVVNDNSTGNDQIICDSSITSVEGIDFLKQLLRQHPGRHVVVVMDQAKPHTSKMTVSERPN